MVRTSFLCHTFFSFLLIVGISGCAKTHYEAREQFSLAGYVFDCQTNEPVANATVYVEAREQTSGMGFFGPTTAEAGSDFTDQNGYYELTPYKYDFTDDFTITVQLHGTERGYIRLSKSAIIANATGGRYDVDTICIYP